MSTADDNHAEPLDLLAGALAEFQSEMPTVPKSHTATVKSDKGSYSYTYAGLAAVSEAAMPLLAKHGLAFTTLPGQGVLTGMLLHKSGQHLTASLPIGGGKPQDLGSSLTYMRRYLLGCMTGLVTDDDDDGQAAQAPARKSTAAQDDPAKTAGRGSQRARPAASESVDVPAPMLDRTRKHMHALFSELNIGEADQRAGIGTVLGLGHAIASRADLTEDQGRIVVAALEKRKAAQTPAVAEPVLDDPTMSESWGQS
jgi:hypothetical protein